MTALLADIGGTHARFALLCDGAPDKIEKLSVSDFADLNAALDHYCGQQNLSKGALYIGTAACEDQGVWHFTNNPRWVIDPAALKNAGWDVRLITCDFKASARGAVALSDEQLSILKTGVANIKDPRVILGPGTGLGLAYAFPVRGGWHVQETFGGHMLASAYTAEHWTILNLMKRFKGDNMIVPEYLASGSGLPTLYKSVCMYNGKLPEDIEAADLLERRDEFTVQQTIRLFHEFLGLFAHNATVTAHAFGGVYLDGGVIHHLQAAGLFDAQHFAKFFELNPVPIVQKALQQTPVWLVNEPYAALYGLAEMVRDGE